MQLSMEFFLRLAPRLPDVYVMFDELWKTRRLTQEKPQTLAQCNRIIEESIRAMHETDCLTRLMFLVPRTLIDPHSKESLHAQLRKAALAPRNKYGLTQK
jgi:hypothetical protein